MEGFWQDFRFGMRSLMRNRRFALLAILVLALGIGANTAIFTVVNSVLLRPLPYRDSGKLLLIGESAPQQDLSVAYLDYLDWRKQNHVFEEMAAFRRDSFNLTGNGVPERLPGRMVSWTFFRVLGANPMFGRDFRKEEDRPGASPVVILSYGLWQRRFGGDRSIIGKALSLNNQNHTVIGIMPPEFDFLSGGDLFVPIDPFASSTLRNQRPGIYVISRMKSQVSVAIAQTEMDTLASRSRKEYPDTNGAISIKVRTLQDDVVGDVRRSLWVLQAAVALILLIACANVASMLLARTAVRQKEIAIRAALGAGRTRIIFQLLTESICLLLVGGAAGLLLAVWGIDLLKSLQPANLPRLKEIGIDGRVLAFTFLTSLITGITCGLIPALRATRAADTEALKETGSRVFGGLRHRRIRYGLVVSEFALALMLLMGATLVIRSFANVLAVEPGFVPENLLTLQLSVSDTSNPAQITNFFQRLESGVSTLPGVKSAAYSNGLPIYGAGEAWFFLEGRPQPPSGQEPTAVEYITSPGYLQTMGIRLLKGRSFTEQDTKNGPKVALIDEALARKYFPDGKPIGKRLNLGSGSLVFEIVGVTAHVKHYGLDAAAQVEPQMYLCFDQVPDEFLPRVARTVSLLVRTESDPLSLAGAVRERVLNADPDQPVFAVQTMEQILADSVAARRFSMFLLTVFAITALLMAAVGIYGVLSYLTVQRTREIGVRMALGARKNDVFCLVVGEGMLLTLVGLGLGMACGVAGLHWISGLLFGVSTKDPLTLFATPFLLAVIGFLACYFPAYRAACVEPATALRYE